MQTGPSRPSPVNTDATNPPLPIAAAVAPHRHPTAHTCDRLPTRPTVLTSRGSPHGDADTGQPQVLAERFPVGGRVEALPCCCQQHLEPFPTCCHVLPVLVAGPVGPAGLQRPRSGQPAV